MDAFGLYKFLITKSLFPLSNNQFAYPINAIARDAGPSFCGLHHPPPYAVQSGLNLGSPNILILFGSDSCWTHSTHDVYF